MQYDLRARINKENEKHEIILDDDHKYKVNNSAAATLQIQAISKEINPDDPEDSLKGLYNMIAVSLGEKAVEYVKKEEYSIEALNTIVSAAAASSSSETLEDFEKRNEEDVTPSK